MALRKIATIGNPILRQVARKLTREELERPETQRFIDDLVETMMDANGAGIAAPQVYESISVCVLHVKDNPRYPYKPNIPLTVLVNPEIEAKTEETFLNYEGCLSVPNLRGEVPRFTEVRVRAWDRNGLELDIQARGITAGTYQHEIDHLQGKLFVDRVVDPTSLCTWQDFERYRQTDFVARAKAVVARFGS
jgi:peptide deformylase